MSDQLLSDRRPKAWLVVAQDIVRTIYEQGLRPGDRYLSESEGIKQHGVGRGTYREAIRFLEYQGVIVIRAGVGGGPEIAEPGWPHLASTIALLLQFADAPLSAILDARVAIEPGMAELAAERATPDELDRMAAHLDALEAALGDYRAFNDAYLRYWRDLAASTHNALLAYLSPALRAIVNSPKFVPDEPYRESILERLRDIHAAVSARDSQSAGSRMQELEIEYRRRLNSGYPRQMERTIAWPDLFA
jgi:GntR family transcriptional regulator, transcriptional repressor for pyruvate dehydrogenase complex